MWNECEEGVFMRKNEKKMPTGMDVKTLVHTVPLPSSSGRLQHAKTVGRPHHVPGPCMIETDLNFQVQVGCQKGPGFKR